MTDQDDRIAAVALKLPTFWCERAEVWFTQAEAQFVTRNISNDETKFYYIVAALDQDTATRVLDLLRNPPTVDKYVTLKNRLIETFTLSESQCAARLLNMPGLGDDRPSHLMDRMLALLGDHQPCFLFRELFLQHMPSDIRAHLVHAKLEDCRALARAADALWSSNNSNVHAIRKLQRSHSHRVVSTPATNKQSSSTTSSTPEGTAPCYYHQRFGDAARQCRPPCSFPVQGNSPAGRQ